MNLNIGNIGVWGFRHYEYLKHNRPSTVGVMRMNGTLENYLKEVNQEAAEMLETLILQYAKAEGVTESLKHTDQLSWNRISGDSQKPLTKFLNFSFRPINALAVGNPVVIGKRFDNHFPNINRFGILFNLGIQKCLSVKRIQFFWNRSCLV